MLPVSVISNVRRAGWRRHYANIRRRRNSIMPTLGGLPPAEKYTILRRRNTQYGEEEIHTTKKEKYTILRRRNTQYKAGEIHNTKKEKYTIQRRRNTKYIELYQEAAS